MKRDTIYALSAALILHVGFFFGGQLFKDKPVVKAKVEAIPTIEVMALPPVEPEPPEVVESAEAATADVADLAPPMQADLPSAVMDSPFVQQIQPPPPPGLQRMGAIAIPTGRPAGGIGKGMANLFNLADLDQPPVPTVRVPPVFPYEMRRSGIAGDVMVGFIVDTNGNVRDAYVVRSSRREFEDEAVKALLKWKFKPGRKAGAPVNTRMQVPLVFNLQS